MQNSIHTTPSPSVHAHGRDIVEYLSQHPLLARGLHILNELVRGKGIENGIALLQDQNFLDQYDAFRSIFKDPLLPTSDNIQAFVELNGGTLDLSRALEIRRQFAQALHSPLFLH